MAAVLAEHLRQPIAGRELTAAESVTCSFGVAEYCPEEDETHILIRVDRAMYRAKRRGRNRVVSAG